MTQNLWQDVRHAVRGLARRPLVSGVAIVSLALGIGVNSAIFSAFERLILRGLPVPAANELVDLRVSGPRPGNRSSGDGGRLESVVSYPLFKDLERLEGTGLASVFAHRDFGASVSFAGQSSEAEGILVSGTYFSSLRLTPTLGRLLGPEDDRVEGGHPVVVLAHAYWSTRFGADRSVVGSTAGDQRRADDDRRHRARGVLRHDHAGCARGLRAAGDGAHREAARGLGRLQRPQRPLAVRIGARGIWHLPFAGGTADERALRRADARSRVPAAAKRPRHHRSHRVPGPPADAGRRRARPQRRPRRGTVGAGGAVRRDGSGAGDRRGQRGEPAVGAGRRPRAGDRGAAVAGRIVVAVGPVAADRGRGAWGSWWNRRRRGSADDADRAHDDVPARGQRAAGLRGQHAGAAVLNRHRPADRARVRPRACAAQRPRQHGRGAAGPAGARIGLAWHPAAAHQPGDGADRAGHGAAGAVGALSCQPGQPLPGGHRNAARRVGDVLAVSGAERLLRRTDRGLLRSSRRIARRRSGRAIG